MNIFIILGFILFAIGSYKIVLTMVKMIHFLFFNKIEQQNKETILMFDNKIKHLTKVS